MHLIPRVRRVALCVALTVSASAACSTSPGTTSHAETAAAAGSGVTRNYFVAADEVEWDYAPSGVNQAEGRPFNDMEKRWMEAGPHTMGRKAKKAIYREYTDATFSALKPRPSEWEHLGFLGPLIRGEVGDTIKIVFKNNAKFPASMHPHGVFYNKDSEGALYNDGTSGADKADDGVPTGATHTYTWQVPERAGPTEHEGSSSIWMYHSHVDEVRDVAAGLLGPIVITRRGMAKPDGSPKDVDRELVAGFVEVDENMSWYLEENIKTYESDAKGVKIVNGAVGEISVTPEGGTYFKETINGFSYGHTPGFIGKLGTHVRWYVMASTNFEFHAPHWHGNVVTTNNMRTDVGMLVPMGMLVADMTPDNPGKWFFHCHVSDHLRMGMQATYVIDK